METSDATVTPNIKKIIVTSMNKEQNIKYYKMFNYLNRTYCHAKHDIFYVNYIP